MVHISPNHQTIRIPLLIFVVHDTNEILSVVFFFSGFFHESLPFSVPAFFLFFRTVNVVVINVPGSIGETLRKGEDVH